MIPPNCVSTPYGFTPSTILQGFTREVHVIRHAITGRRLGMSLIASEIFM